MVGFFLCYSRIILRSQHPIKPLLLKISVTFTIKNGNRTCGNKENVLIIAITQSVIFSER